MLPSWNIIFINITVIILWYCVVTQIGEHNWVIWKQNKWVYDLYNMLVSFQNDIVVLVHMWSICVSLIVVFSTKVSLKLYLFINAYNVDDWFVFVKMFILKFPIITIEQCESIFCTMFFKIELTCDTYILGGLYIAIMYNASHVLSLKSAVINLTLQFVIVVFSVNDTLSS